MWDFIVFLIKSWISRLIYDLAKSKVKQLAPILYNKTKRGIKYYCVIQYRKIIQVTREALDFINHPFYNRIGIGLSYLFLIVCFMYAALAFAIKIEEGHDSVTKLLLGMAFFAFASINYFRASINLYK